MGFSAWAFTQTIVYRDSPVRPDASFDLPTAPPLAIGAPVRYVSPEEDTRDDPWAAKDWFEVTEVRGLVKEGEVSQVQVKLKVGFRIFGEDEMRGA